MPSVEQTNDYESLERARITQEIIDDSFPTTIKDKIIKEKLSNTIIVKSIDGILDAKIELTPKNFLGKGLSGLVMIGKTEKGPTAFKMFTSKDSVSNDSTQTEYDSEVDILKGLDHPNLASFYGTADVELTKSSVIKVIARELIPIEFRRLKLNEAVQMSEEIASVLDYINEKKGAILPDLTPEGIRQRTNGSWVLLDVGHSAKPSEDQSRIIQIDDIYTAPEVKFAKDEDRNKAATPASEVFSLALIVWKGLSGSDYDRINPEQIFDEKIGEFSPLIIDVLKKATSREPGDRYQTPTEFAEALRNATAELTAPEQKAEDPIRDPRESGESIISPKLKDFSGKSVEEVRKRVKNILPYVIDMTVFHDLSPTDERKGLIPTGSIAEIDTLEHKDWLKLLGGSDMGCGIEFAALESTINIEDAQNKLDQISDKVSSGELSLGGGNHFIDIMEDSNGKYYVAIHTGAPRDEQEELNQIVEQAKEDGNWEEATIKYLAKYDEIIKSANDNREKILAAITEVYGKCDTLYHEPHNTIDINKEKNTVTIYKGAVHVTDTRKKQFMPSSMNEGAVFFIPGPTVGEKTHFGVPHGTGKARSTGEQRADPNLDIHPNIMLPTSAGGVVSRGVAEGAYNTYAKAEEIMLNCGIARYESEEDIEIFKTVAHIRR